MLTLLIVVAFIVVLVALYWRTVMSNAKSLRRVTAISREKNGRKEKTAIKNKGDGLGEGEIIIQESIQEHPSVVTGRLRKQFTGHGTYIRKLGHREWPSDRISESPMHEDLVCTQKKVEHFLEEKEEMYLISPTEIKLLINATDERWRPLIITACYTGMKGSELFGLLWEDVDFEGARIHVRRTYQDDGRFHSTEPDAQERSIIVPPIVLEALKDHRERQAKNHIETSHHFVFTTLHGNALNRRMLNEKIFSPALRRAGIKRIHFDSLRCSYDAALTNAGESLAFIQRQLGYPPDKESMDTSKDLLTDTEKGASNRIALIFGTVIMPQKKAS